MALSEAQMLAIAAYLADWWAQRLRQGDKEAFKANLSAAIMAELEKRPDRPYIDIECDYDPQGILLDAVRAAGVECRGMMFSAKGILPEKHSTTVYPEKVAEPEFEEPAFQARVVTKEGYGRWNDPIPLDEVIIADRAALGAKDSE